MKKHLLLILITLLSVKINAQCTVATPTVSENFNSTVLPTCWTNLNGWALSGTDIWATENQNWPPMLILPKTDNAKGILTFKARMNSAFGPPAMYIGVVSAPGSPASYVNIFNFNVTNATMTSYTVDLSSYTGNYQYIAIRLPSNNGRRLYLDDINYVSACFSSSVTAIAQNYTVQLSNTGQKSITGANIDNGSTTTCGSPTLSVNPSVFDCSNVGINTVTLTAIDNNGHSATATASVTILPAINNESVTAVQNTICSGKTATITTGSSIVGINYYLRENTTNNIVSGPIVGTGSSLSFNTGTLTSNTTFNINAETKPSYFAVDLDGTNDYINLTTNNRGITNAVTVSAKIKTSISTVTQYVANKYTSGSQGFLLTIDANTGKARFDGRDGGTTYKTSGPSITNVADNQWHEITGVLRNTGWEIYVDGILENSGAYSLGGSGVANGAALTVGSYSTSYSGLAIDNITIWNTSLTQTQIQSNISSCLTGTETNLKGYFKFDEGTAATLTDLCSTPVDGTIVNANNTTCWINSTAGSCNYPAICSLEMSDLITINISATPTISVNSGSICTGDSFTITPSGANTYTIQGGSAIKTPTANTTYTVTGTSTAGCISTSFATASVTVNSTPTISVNSGSICNGQSFTITPSGASTYTFSNGSVVTPTANTSYTVTGTSSSGCVNTIGAVCSVTVNSIPTITVANGTICPGSSFTLSPSGASSYTYSSGSAVVSPTSTSTYSISGTSAAGCISSTPAIATVTVSNNLNVVINGTNTVCNGQAINLTAGGASTYTWNTGATSSTIAPTPTTNTTYSVIGASGTCSNTAIISVTVNALPSINAVSNETLLCTGSTASLTANGASTYTWNTGGIGATITVSPSVTTTYTVTGTDANGCENNTIITQDVSLCTGINNIAISNNAMTLFPNPSSSILTIQTIEEIKAVYIFNTLGDLVRTEKTHTFSIEQLESGIYMIHVKTEKGMNTLRFIRE